MPLEIRELVIKTALGEDTRNTVNNSQGEAHAGRPAGQEAIVKACVERVLEIIRQKNER